MTLVAGSLALLISAGAPGVNAQEPVAGQCLDPQLCPIPYVRLAKQETEPFLFFGKVVDEDHPRYGDYGRALRRFPDVRSCLIVSEREKPQPDLRQIDWDAIQDIREIEVCVFRVASSTEDVETVQRWLEYHQFTKVSTRSIYHNNYVPENENEALCPCFRCDQHLVGDGLGREADSEEAAEGGMAGSAAVEAEDELVEIGLQMLASEAVIDAQGPGFEV